MLAVRDTLLPNFSAFTFCILTNFRTGTWVPVKFADPFSARFLEYRRAPLGLVPAVQKEKQAKCVARAGGRGAPATI